jgi:manganese/zinc/iron transport system permease protein
MTSDQFIGFLILEEPNVRMVVAGTLLLCGMAALVGCFTFLRKRSLVGDAVSHSVLPGICMAFLLSGEKNPIILLLGALATGLLSLILMEVLSRNRLTRPDTAISLMLSFFFGLGILLLTYIQHQGNAAQAGLDKFIFGKAASITEADLRLFFFSGIFITASVAILLRGFYLISFDEDFARATGFPIKFLRLSLSVLTVWTVAIGIQAVGVVLMAALLITPALAARFWTHSIGRMLVIAALFGMIAGYTGSFVSYLAPAMPTGPWIVVMATFIAVVSMFLAPGRGLLARWNTRSKNREKTLLENILKLFYQIGEKSGQLQGNILEEDLLNHRAFGHDELRKGLKRLTSKNLLESNLLTYRLTNQGLLEAQRIVRLHRLWELYLQRYLHLEPDHVHDDAEAMEHVITPEIEAQLELILGNPETDPHNTIIPPKA